MRSGANNMATYCIPPELADTLLKAIKKDDVIGNVQSLYEMTSKERRDAFAKHVGETAARDINAAFEKALVSNQKTALAKWATQTFNSEAKKSGRYKSTVDKINALSEEGLLSPETESAFLEDLVRDKLGVTITAKEAQIISEKAAKIEELSQQVSAIGLPPAEYFKAKADMDKYLQSQMPTHNLKVLTSTIGRAVMLTSFKSPILNIESNTVQGVLTAFERRIGRGEYRGLNSGFARTYIKENMKIFQQSGYDLSRMLSFADDKKILGEEQIVHSQGPGAVRFVGRVAEDTVFKQLMGAPDVAFSSVHFTDSANLASTNIAQSEGLKGKEAKARALEVFKDAVLIEPKTIEGELVRSQAIADAQYATYTNKSAYSDLGLAIRGLLNKFTGDARIGDQIMPFVKTPANVVGAGIDFSGVSLPAQVYLLPKALLQARHGEKEALKRSIKTLVRSGLGMTFAYLLSSLFKPEDFIGNYPVTAKEQELLELKNATTNSIRIGNKWVSLDYFGPLAAPLVGMMYAKKYGQSPPEKVIKYYQGVITQAQKVPGVREFSDIVKDIQDFTNEAKTGGKELTTAATNAVLDYIRSRTVPAILYDYAKATDPYERVMDVKKDPLARIKGAIPGLRQTLPEKTTVFGDTIKAESALSTLLFGARVKTKGESNLIDELIRLDTAGQLPSITDVEKTNPRVKELKVQIGDGQYVQAIKYYRQLLKNGVERTVESGKYRKGTDEDKKKAIESTKNDALEKMLKKYRYKKPKK
jgi:hypothetical protein